MKILIGNDDDDDPLLKIYAVGTIDLLTANRIANGLLKIIAQLMDEKNTLHN